jgi:cytochrome c-type biogenesis protein CcmH
LLIWLILAGLTALVLVVLLRPLAARTAEHAPEGFDAAVYRDQLNEIESDRARGLIGVEEAEAAQIEISRRLLAADSNARQAQRSKVSGAPARAALLGVAVALPLLALGLYLV